MSIDDVTRWTQYDVPWEARAGFTFNLLHAPWKARVWFGYACVPHAETIALAAGYHKTETSSSTLIDDMWYSKDGGQSWIGTGAFPWAGRYSLGMEFVHNQGKLFIFSGRGSRQ